MYAARSDFDDEQDMKAMEERGVDAGEVGGDDPFGLDRMNCIQVGPVRS
jgi:hypothetical protein